jgi:hypothetical protein
MRYEKIEVLEGCKRFKEAVEDGYIGFDNEPYTTTYFGLNIAKHTSYPEDSYNEYMRIEYCPFCGSPININLEEEFRGKSKRILNHKARKSSFLKGLNEVLLMIILSNEKDKAKRFVYKYGMNKIVWL